MLFLRYGTDGDANGRINLALGYLQRFHIMNKTASQKVELNQEPEPRSKITFLFDKGSSSILVYNLNWEKFDSFLVNSAVKL